LLENRGFEARLTCASSPVEGSRASTASCTGQVGAKVIYA